MLPVIKVLTTPTFLLHIMSPWMPGGNITQYIRLEPAANPLRLVRAHLPEEQ